MMLSFHSTHEFHLQESDLYYFLMVMFIVLFCIWFTNMSNEPKSIIERLLICVLDNKNKLTKCNLIRNRGIQHVTTLYSIVDWTRRSSIPHKMRIMHNTSLDLQILWPWHLHVVDPTPITISNLEEELDVAIVNSQYIMMPNPLRIPMPSSIELVVVSISHHLKQMAMQHDKYHQCLHDNYFTTNP
jgi:hypothetical protein